MRDINCPHCLDFLCFLIWPFIDSYWLAAVSLFSLAQPNRPSGTTGPVKADMKVFSNRAQALGKTLYYQGDLVCVYACVYVCMSFI